MRQPPKFPIMLLRLLAGRQISEEIEGDLYEDYLDNVASKGLRKARNVYRWTAIRSLRPYLVAHRRENRKPKYIDMVLYHFKMAIRYMSKSRMFTAINIFGLTLGLASSLAILLFIIDQAQMDNFLSKRDRIYRLESSSLSSGSIDRSVKLHSDILPTIAPSLPEIEAFVRMQHTEKTIVFEGNGKRNLSEERFLLADQGFFEVFDFEIISGEPEEALTAPSATVITEATALRLFGTTDVIGETLQFGSQYDSPQLITAVMKDPPVNSSLQFSFVTSISDAVPPPGKGPFKARFNANLPVYVLFAPGTSAEILAEKIAPALSKHTDKDKLLTATYSFQSLYDLKRDIQVSDDLINPVDHQTIRIFSLIALFIICLALINYVNLSSARAIQRTREAGLRKIIGASRSTLIRQMLAESLITCLIAVPLSILTLELVLPYFETVLGKELLYHYKSDLAFLSGLLGFTFLISILAGFYPALLISRFKFSDVVKGRPELSSKGVILRKLLVVVQFTVSIALIISVFLVQNQLDFIRNQTLSYAPEQIIVIKGRFGILRKNHKTIKSEMLQLPGVQKVSVSNSSPGDDFFMSSTNPSIPFSMTNYIADEDYFDLFNIKLRQGQKFNPAADSASTHILINEALAKALEVENPLYSTAFKFFGRGNNKIIGIVEDFHFESLRNEVKPTFFIPAASFPSGLTQIIVKVRPTGFEQTIEQLEAIWNEFHPNDIFEYQFLDAKLDRLYTSEQRLSRVFGLFTILAIIISCLGLFGLSIHMAEMKLKEASIRKVLGASAGQIMKLLSGQVYLLVIIAALLATPLAWYFIKQWLQGFAYQITISPMVFVFTLLACLVIATITVSWHTIKTAWVNPADTLRNE